MEIFSLPNVEDENSKRPSSRGLERLATDIIAAYRSSILSIISREQDIKL